MMLQFCVRHEDHFFCQGSPAFVLRIWADDGAWDDENGILFAHAELAPLLRFIAKVHEAIVELKEEGENDPPPRQAREPGT